MQGCSQRACHTPTDASAGMHGAQAQLAAAVEKGSRTSGLHSRVAELEDRLQQVREPESVPLGVLHAQHSCWFSDFLATMTSWCLSSYLLWRLAVEPAANRVDRPITIVCLEAKVVDGM